MTRTRILPLALSALTLLITAAPAQAQTSAKKITIGLAVANLQANFFNQIKQSVERNAKAQGITVITVDAKGDSATQVSQIQDLIARNVDAIIYIPAGATAASVPVKAARAAGIPVVNVDRNAEGAPGDTFIATDSVLAAKTLGDYVCKQTGGKGNVAVIQGQIGTTPEQDRDKGFTQALSKCPGLKVVAKQASTAWAQDEGFNIAQDMLQKNPTISVFFGRADALALGAAQATKVAGQNGKVMIVGFDGDTAGLQAVKGGTLAATMTQRTQYMGQLAVKSAVDLVNKKAVPKVQLQPATLTTKANVTPFITNHP